LQKYFIIFLVAVQFLIFSNTQAEVYSWTDENGVLQFSDVMVSHLELCH